MRLRAGLTLATLVLIGTVARGAAAGQDASLPGWAALLPGSPDTASIRPPPGSPDPKLMALRLGDLGRGAKVSHEGYYKDRDFPSVISYSREFESARAGATELLYVDSEAEVGTSAESTVSFFDEIRQFLSTKQGRAEFKKGFESGLGEDVGLITSIQIGRPRSIGVGDRSFDLLISFRLLGLRTEAHLTVFVVDRVLGALISVGSPDRRVPRAVLAKLAKIVVDRAGAELRPRSTAPPGVSGSPQAGQTLTATTGSWSGDPASFAYQWQRCDAAGASCADISGATGQSYLVTDADVGSTLRVAVTAVSRFGSITAFSAPTAVVSPSGGIPANTAPPATAGTAQQGQTLSASTGSWTNAPTSFAYQWQRCDAAASCTAIPGATGPSYTVSAADVGSTLRVAVTATNAAGSATAVSAPTAVVT